MREWSEKPVRSLGAIANCGKPRAAKVLENLMDSARALGLQVAGDEATAELMGIRDVLSIGEMASRVDAIVALGGDGTMLRVVRDLDGRDRPLLGVNIGALGFLTSIAEEDLPRALQCLAEGNYVIGSRSIAECVLVRAGRELSRYRGLNEVVVSSGPSSRVVTLDLSVGMDTGTSYVCDGLIVSTPTGSTGHSLSAGGPILVPETRAFVISVICPHTLSSRPLVVPDSSEIVVTAASGAGEMRLAVDGQVGQPLVRGDVVKVRRSPHDVHFIHLPGYSYFKVLRQKLHWSGSSVQPPARGPGA
jgi:NAD+ kinase